MTRDEFNASIRAIYDFYARENFIEAAIYMISLPRSADFNKISLTSLNYNKIFEAGLSLSHYNFALADLAYFQFSYQSEAEWALAFYPNPRISGCPEAFREFIDLKEAAGRGEITDEEFSSLASSIYVGNYLPRVRLEYSQNQYKPVRHPLAHFHIGMSGQDRWASSRKISPKSFGLLIAKHYYPEIWWPNSRFDLAEEEQNSASAVENCLDEKLVNSLHADGVSHGFGAFERRTFHFAAMQPSVQVGGN